MTTKSLRSRMLSTVASSSIILMLAGTAGAATSSLDLDTLAAISDATLTSGGLPQVNTASVSATASTSAAPVTFRFIETATAGDTVITGAFPVEANTLSATANGNTTTAPDNNLIDITVLPSFNDSAAVTSVQDNTGNVTASSVAGNFFATIDSSTGDRHELTGSITLDGNTAATTANGNNATNTIAIADAVSVGDGGAAGSINSGYDATVPATDPLAATAVGDLVVNAGQQNAAVAVLAETLNTEATMNVDSVDLATLSVSNNDFTATANGNLSNNTIRTGTDSAAIASSMVVSNYQDNTDTTVTANSTSNYAGLIVGNNELGFGVDNSTATVDSNTMSARATGSSTTQTVNLSATNVLASTGTATLAAGITTSPQTIGTGEALISNVQDRTNTDVSASADQGWIELIADSSLGTSDNAVLDSTLSLTNNTQEAVAVAANAANQLTLAGTTVGGGAGIVSAQSGDATSDVLATASITGMGLYADNLENSSASVQGNLIRAIGAGNILSSGITVTANDVNIAANAGSALSGTNGADPTATAAFANVSNQEQLGDVTATSTGAAFENYVNAALNSTVVTDGNDIVAAAYGNDASSRISLTSTTIDTTGFAAVAASVSNQEVSGDVLARATGWNNGIAGEANVNLSATDSSVSTSDNSVQALAIGNRTTTVSTMVDATSINTASTAPAVQTLGVIGGPASATSSFTAVNTQTAGGTVTAATREAGGADSAFYKVTVQDDLIRSTATADGNSITASATANSGVTATQVSATNTATTTATVNAQSTNSVINALMGVAGTGAVDAANYTSTVTGAADASVSVRTVTVNSGTLSFDISSLTGAERTAYAAALTSAGFTETALGSNIYSAGVGSYTFPNNVNTVVYNGVAGTVTFGTVSVAASAGSPNEGGVIAQIGNDVLDSTISVASNIVAGSVTGNAATNTLSLSGTNLNPGSTTLEATTAVTPAATSVTADNALTNTQAVSSSAVASEVYGSFGIDTSSATADTIDGSALSVAGNTQSATAVGNTATSTASLNGTNINTTTALGSTQSVNTNLDALSDVDMFAEVSSVDSTISITGNTNRSVAVGNEAASAVSVTGTNIASLSADAAEINTVSALSPTSQADASLSSVQMSYGTIDANAVTNIANDDFAATATNGILNGTVAFDSNTTVAEASANRGTNTVTLGGDGATLLANGSLSNAQNNTAAVTSTASVDAAMNVLALNTTSAAVTNSTVSVDGNSTTATARGNVASNRLTATGTLVDGTGVESSVASGLTTADQVLVSYQLSTGAMDANANGSYGLTLNNDTFTVASTVGSALSVSGNTLASQGLGNISSNAIVVDGTTVDAGSALVPRQENSANIAADTVMNLTVSVNSSTSAISLDSNAARSLALANDATNSVSVAGTNLEAISATTEVALDGVNGVASGGNLLFNTQVASGATLTANTTLNASNYGSAFVDTTGISSGSVTFNGNMAVAEASSNRASNTMTLDGSASLAATGGVQNAQINGQAASAEASSSVGIDLNGALASTAVLNSAVSVDGNSTTALARGNVVSNNLTVSAANITGDGTTGTTTAATQLVTASYGVLNAQSNNAPVSAVVNDTSYVMALNATDNTFAALSTGTASVSGNVAAATALGNSASNALVLTGLNSATSSAAVGSYQNNAAAVTASVVSTNVGYAGFGTVSGSTVAVSGNTLSASATGNSVSNVIRRN